MKQIDAQYIERLLKQAEQKGNPPSRDEYHETKLKSYRTIERLFDHY